MLNLRVKILAVAAALVLLSQAGTVVTVLVTAKRDVAERASSSLIAGADVIERATQNRAAQFGNTVAALASDYGFRQAVATGDTATVTSALANHAMRAGADIALLFDNDGQLIASTGSESSRYMQPDLPRQIPGQQSGHFGVALNGIAYEVFAVPVRAPLPIAELSMGYALTDDYARRLSALTGMHVSIVARREDRIRVMASSLGDTQRNALGLLPAAAIPGNPAVTELGHVDHLAIGRPMISAGGPLMVVLTNSLRDAMAPYHLLRSAAIALGAVPLLLALAGAVLLSRALTRPVYQLVAAARRMQAGDYGRPVVIATGDELQEFAVAFNSMQDEIARREERITYQSRHDSLTGLCNRDYALELLDAEIARMRATSKPLAVAVLELNALAEIESTLGHDIADKYLKQAADFLAALTMPPRTLARLDSDSFLLILPGSGQEDAHDLAEKLLQQLQRGIALPDVQISVRPFVGIATFPLHGEKRDQLLLRATIALGDAGSSRHRVRIYRPGDEAERRKRLALLQEIRGAARRDEFMLHYQPKVSVCDETVCGAEALVRWIHPVFGCLSPAEFIPILEKSGNISVLTRWALTQAARQFAEWRDAGLELDISVNLSAQDLQDRELPWFVHDLLRDHGMDPRRLIAEVTEEAMVRDFAPATAVLRRLRELGIRISIDDFGTGYSSLAQLRDLPVDELKIDKSFVSRLPDDHRAAAIVRTAIDLAHNLELEFVAEGIETGDAFRWMRDNGAERVQGYYFSPPLPPEQFQHYVREFCGGRTIRSPSLQAG